MCIIAYKERNATMPTRETLATCFRNNPDGAGFMYLENGQVQIYKGYMTFNSFYSALCSKKYAWNTSPFVLHFRISTQAGVNKECTHPFPLSSKMADLKQLKTRSNIGIAHNGIISLTSHYYKQINHSDTMEFITDYLSLLIDSVKYYKNARTVEIIKKLADSKLAILDNMGHCELIGEFENVNGIHYSNGSYKERETVKISTAKSTNYYTYSFMDDPDYDDYFDGWEMYRDWATRKYYFDDGICPAICDDDWSYCSLCSDKSKCREEWQSYVESEECDE